MTKNQIEVILTEIGNYSTNKIIPLTEVSEILLNLDAHIYPDESTQVEFKTTDECELLLVYNGYIAENGIFKHSGIPTYIIPFNQIYGFILNSNIRMKSPYKLAMQI